jgi:hypothetical protein
VNDIAGVVHGREFVVNAEGTARNRPLLEAMNRGESVATANAAYVSMKGSSEKITIVNQTTGRIDSVEERRISPNERMLIVKEAVDQAVRTTATQFSDPNSKISKGLKAGYRVETKR